MPDIVDILSAQLDAAKQRELELLAVIAEITSAAQAVIDRWETPLWKDVKPTGVFIYALRDAIQIEPSQALREHEAKVVAEYKQHAVSKTLTNEEILSAFDAVMDSGDWDRLRKFWAPMIIEAVRRIDEERRKK